MTRKKLSLLDPVLCREACKGAFIKLILAANGRIL